MTSFPPNILQNAHLTDVTMEVHALLMKMVWVTADVELASPETDALKKVLFQTYSKFGIFFSLIYLMSICSKLSDISKSSEWNSIDFGLLIFYNSYIYL